jgi:hypothetical protein
LFIAESSLSCLRFYDSIFMALRDKTSARAPRTQQATYMYWGGPDLVSYTQQLFITSTTLFIAGRNKLAANMINQRRTFFARERKQTQYASGVLQQLDFLPLARAHGTCNAGQNCLPPIGCGKLD